MQIKILVVEDDKVTAEILKEVLENEGFSLSLLHRGDEVEPTVRNRPPDLILLDVMLPGKDGLAVCRGIRSFSQVPILMLTSRVEEIDRLLGLELGADDYICKPFSPREVVARVKAVMRRVTTDRTSEAITSGPLVLDKSTHQVRVGTSILDLTPIEFDLLQVLMRQPERVYSRDDLIAKVQGYDFQGYSRTIDTHIKNLRKKIGKHLPDQEIIRTVYGVGYSFSPLPI
jgi:two-component system response regulator BaeR